MVWKAKAQEEIYAGPALEGELLAFGSFDGYDTWCIAQDAIVSNCFSIRLITG